MGAKKANAGAANLQPANRKGKIGVRKKVTKTILQSLTEFIEDEMPEHLDTVRQLKYIDPVAYDKAMQGIYKILMPRIVQAEVTMNGGTGAGAPIVNINFGKQQIEVAELPQETIASEETKAIAQAPTGFVLQLPVYEPLNNCNDEVKE